MNRIVLIIGLSFMSVVSAQNFGNLSAEDIAQLEKQAKAAQACMGEINQMYLLQLAAKAQDKHEELKAMCRDGQRSEAQSEAIRYGKALVKDPEMQKMQDCMGRMQGGLPQIDWASLEDTDDPARHICDIDY